MQRPLPPRPDVLRALFVLLVAVASLSLLAIGEVAAAELPSVEPASLIQWG
jgi:hypothetical protein